MALGIVGALGVLAAVELDDELLLEADEVDDVASELLLPAELEAAEAAVAQQAPHPPLGFRRLAPHLARPVLQEVLDHRLDSRLGRCHPHPVGFADSTSPIKGGVSAPGMSIMMRVRRPPAMIAESLPSAAGFGIMMMRPLSDAISASSPRPARGRR